MLHRTMTILIPETRCALNFLAGAYVSGGSHGHVGLCVSRHRAGVSSGIEMDPATFASLRYEDVRCPYCLQLHRLNELRAWIAVDSSGVVPDEGAVAA
jgi:hypothetical protein